MFGWLFYLSSWIEFGICAGFILSLTTFLVPLLLQIFVFKQQNLKQKYGAKWALVTGGSSGIGRAISEKLASQGINVVIVALDDHLLHDLDAKLKKEYPELEFRSVGVDLSSEKFMEPIINATKDIDVQLLFNNAGYIMIGLFADTSIERQLKNYHVNATSAIYITHHFLHLMIAKKLRGAVSFTSSPAGLMPCPFSVIYGSTKAFLTEFATSIACEVNHDGIDVLVIHPSPVDTNFYNSDTAHKSSSLGFFRKTASPPTLIADIIFGNLGKFAVVREQGYFSITLRLLLKVVDYNFLSWIFSKFGHLSAEYKKLVAERK